MRPGPTIACPHCAGPLDCHVGVTNDTPPSDGDFTLCWRCRRVAVYVVGPFGMTLRVPTEDEEAEIGADPCGALLMSMAMLSGDPVEAAARLRSRM